MLNKVMIIGNICQDIECKFTPSGQAVTNLSIATNMKWKDKSGKSQEKTEFHRCVVWGKQAENCSNYLQKGSKAYVEGRLETRKWTDKNGVEKYTTEIIANTVQFLDSKSDRGAVNTSKPTDQVVRPTKEQAVQYFSADEIPF